MWITQLGPLITAMHTRSWAQLNCSEKMAQGKLLCWHLYYRYAYTSTTEIWYIHLSMLPHISSWRSIPKTFISLSSSLNVSIVFLMQLRKYKGSPKQYFIYYTYIMSWSSLDNACYCLLLIVILFTSLNFGIFHIGIVRRFIFYHQTQQK